MRRLDEMNHLVNDHVFEKVLGLFHQLGVEANMARLVVAASPFGLHSLQEISGELHLELSFPFPDERRHNVVEKRFMPLVDHLGASWRIAARAHGEHDPPVVERNERLGVPIGDR